MAETASRIVDRANVLRMERSMAPVSVNAQLQAAAEAFARHMAKTGEHSHTADGRTPVQRAVAAGYDFCMVTENIGYHASSREPQSADVLAERLVRGWRDSPGHRRNIEDAAALETGVGVARDARGRYFAAQMFGRPRSAAMRFSVVNPSGEALQYRVGAQEHTAPPRTVRTHELCRPAEIHVEPPGQVVRQ